MKFILPYFIIIFFIISDIIVFSHSVPNNETEINNNNSQSIQNNETDVNNNNNSQYIQKIKREINNDDSKSNPKNETDINNNKKPLSNEVQQVKIARPSIDGKLYVNGTSLVNSKEETVILKGLSTHGLTWYPAYVNKDLFTFLSEEWDMNLIRLAMYSESYIKNKKENLEILYRGIDAAIESNMYVLIDWHILNDYDPMMNVEEAKEFFNMISEKYANVPNLIYEICNEPNQGAKWENIYKYSNIIVPIIRNHNPNAVIIIGTPNYDQDLESAIAKPVSFKNVMYTFHFYSAEHHDDLMVRFENAIKSGLPVFISECGITMGDGNGNRDYEYAVKWFDLLNKYQTSYAIWNLSNKKENSSIIKASSRESKKLLEKDLTGTGKWVRSLLKGVSPSDIPQGDVNEKYTFWETIISLISVVGYEKVNSLNYYSNIIILCTEIFIFLGVMSMIYFYFSNKKCWTYDQFIRKHGLGDVKVYNIKHLYMKIFIVMALWISTLMYLIWRCVFTFNKGILPIICNSILLIVEIAEFLESCIFYTNLLKCKKYPVPVIEDDEFPDVDIFIATYNESEELLRKTINGCNHLDYPDKKKVHIWVCDDNRRSNIRQLAKKMNVGYFDRPDNKGAKAGNLNNAMSHTFSPYIVTLDADMIVKSNFLLKTIPYFIYVEKCNAKLSKSEQRHLGFLQTPQCFYEPDIFQYNLYSETKVPNEQDFFYRLAEVSRTSSNSVIYGGSNTVISRKALEDVGGFYTESITEDYATGLLLESKGYLSLATPEPLASGMTPNTFDDHIKQRSRWACGVVNIIRNKHMNPLWNMKLHFIQRLNYISSAFYWYTPFNKLIYMISPFFFAVFNIPVFRCTSLEIMIYWLPMFILQNICLRILTNNMISIKWSNIFQMSVMPFLITPVLKETFGISKKKFKVTDKSNNKSLLSKKKYIRMIPFIIFGILSIIGVIRISLMINLYNTICPIIILFWLCVNFYTIVMIIFLISGREKDEENDEYIHSAVVVRTNEVAIVEDVKGIEKYAITSVLMEHTIKLLINTNDFLEIGDVANVNLNIRKYKVRLNCVVTSIRSISEQYLLTMEIKNYDNEEEYLQILFDRMPTLPQTLKWEFFLTILWRNILYRFIRMFSYFYIEKPIAKPITKPMTKQITKPLKLEIVIE
ncbi:hypothetical protein BCR32DRAFT_247468 [Anaeromyces robustus]|uniref:Glycoside hydrolase n=1 Tax=Anaeromyces robustus TaxID=1754192 RepID=A0A1Y1WXX2_9FUNG|nr:hypothetical protein BCR32DRAFT_247468 [Anaeromyces robustus]|eukprot:ORX78046.1 hypothetical protein BCR32DRAFT_247468 [Anaeromyces robustus]